MAKNDLIVWREWDTLASALREVREWEEDQIRHGVGQVALAFNPAYFCPWLVLVSNDLIRAELPF